MTAVGNSGMEEVSVAALQMHIVSHQSTAIS